MRSIGGRGKEDGQFECPCALAFDLEENLLVVDRNNRCQVFNSLPPHGFKYRFGDHGESPGQLSNPVSLSIDSEGNIIICDCGNHRVQIFNSKGEFEWLFGKKGGNPGQLNSPISAIVDVHGHFVVCENGNHRIQIFDQSGNSIRCFGSHGSEFEDRCFSYPYGMDVDRNGTIVVADATNALVQVWTVEEVNLDRNSSSLGTHEDQSFIKMEEFL